MQITKNLWKHLLTAFLCILLAACSGAGSSSNPSEKPEEQGVTLVDFTGLDKIDVEDWINKNSVDRNQVYYSWEYSETVQQGRVIRQSLPAGSELGENTVNITLSNGPDPEAEITLIDFTGMSAEDIQKWFMNEHFQHVSVEYVYDPTLAPGTFIGTSAVNGKALRTDPIVVKIAGDPEQAGVAVTVPDMTGWNRGQAEEWANKNQITIDYTVTMDASVPAGNIISFSPQAGTEIVMGDHISAVVSAGSQVEAADFTGYSKDDIDAWGQQNGITISYVQCWNASPSGTIVGNQPNSGVMRMGDIMNVYVSVGPIPVHSYVGLSYQNNFMGWLNSINSQYNSTANLNVSVSEQSSDQESGVILSQSPNDGYINPGDTISLVVSKYSAPVDPTPGLLVNIPSMTGFSESDFQNALSSYGMSPGRRVEQYSQSISQGFIISNETGQYPPGDSIDYIVSLGTYKVVPQYWAGQDYDRLVNEIDSANRMGANVRLDVTYEPTHDQNAHNKIHNIQGPASDGEIDVWVWRVANDNRPTGFGN